MNSDWIRSTRHGSVWTQSVAPRLSSSRWSVVECGAVRSPRTTGPCTNRCSGSSAMPPSYPLCLQGSAQPADQRVAAGNDVVRRAKLIVGVRLGGVARPKVDRWDAHRAEPRHISPPQLGRRFTADRAKEFCRRRLIQTWSGTSGDIEDADRITVQNFADVRLSLGGRFVGCEPVVDLDQAAIGDHIARNAAIDRDGVQPFTIGQTVDLDLSRL